jgi:hypothetical protein
VPHTKGAASIVFAFASPHWRLPQKKAFGHFTALL